jgi:hypothetical protein
MTGANPTGRQVGDFAELTMNGDLYAFVSFAYDVFTLADNAEVQQSLLNRIKNVDQFQGSRYEVFVAASLLRAGFKIAFEDESDSRTSHCEFTATHKETNRSFSVEAKSRHRRSAHSNVERAHKARAYKILQNALSKTANHERIVFVDVNLPPDKHGLLNEEWHREIASTLRALEESQRIDAPWPQAILFFTNRKTSPWPSAPSGARSTVILTAINHPLFKGNDGTDLP